MKKCFSCGKENNDQLTTCWKCGESLDVPPDTTKRTEEFVHRQIKARAGGREELRTQSWFKDIQEPRFKGFRRQMDSIAICLIIGIAASFFFPILIPPVSLFGIIGIIYLVYKYTKIKES